MRPLYERVCIRGLEFASGPRFPGPICYFFATGESYDKCDFIKYNDEWYLITPRNTNFVIDKIVNCKEHELNALLDYLIISMILTKLFL